METMEFYEEYDCIFFNHVVLFVENPLALYHKFSKALKRDGKFICTWGGKMLFENLAELLIDFMPSHAKHINSCMKESL